MYYSIIIPTYNEEQYIEQCLHSILQQNIDRSEYEIIVSDASSSDQTCERAKRLANKIVVTKQRGISIGRNLGAREARGDILVFVDADATLAPDFLSHCHKIFSNSFIVGMTGIAKPSDGGILQRFVYRGTYGLVRCISFLGNIIISGNMRSL